MASSSSAGFKEVIGAWLQCVRPDGVDDNAPIMGARWTAWIVWAALAASLVFWGLRLSGRSAPVPAHAETVATGQAVQGDVLRLFAATHAASQPAALAPDLAARLRVLGVVAGARAGSPGWALIAVDGRAPRAVAVGATVDGELILQSVTQTRAEIGPRGGAVVASLELPLLPPPATGTLAIAPAETDNAAVVRPDARASVPMAPDAAAAPLRLTPGRFGVPVVPPGEGPPTAPPVENPPQQ
jgi:general secretion pathway protein C